MEVQHVLIMSHSVDICFKTITESQPKCNMTILQKFGPTCSQNITLTIMRGTWGHSDLNLWDLTTYKSAHLHMPNLCQNWERGGEKWSPAEPQLAWGWGKKMTSIQRSTRKHMWHSLYISKASNFLFLVRLSPPTLSVKHQVRDNYKAQKECHPTVGAGD